jgi:integrase
VPRGAGFHGFRHLNATLMDQLNAPVKTRQQRLAHSDSNHV